jgi:thiol:disulfide interchange protein DsbD
MKKGLILIMLQLLVFFNLAAQFLNRDTSSIPLVQVQIEVTPEDIIPGEVFSVRATYEIPENYHMFLNKDLFNIFITDTDFEELETVYPMDEAEDLLGFPAFSSTVTISRQFRAPSNFNSNEAIWEIRAAYQICEDDGTCLLPSYKSLIMKNKSSNGATGWFIVLRYILLAFTGGLILNIMPCVLPLLSVKALNLIEQSKHDKKTIILSSILYAAGILVSFLSLALIVIFLKSSGEFFGWGFQFQNPYFVFILLSLIFIFALSLFDVFIINAPGQGIKSASSARKSYSGSFVTGIFAVLVATPCTAPFMGAALGFAFSQTPLIIISIFTALSFGFALPFLLLGFFPGLIKRIPKPGKWMNTFKEFMGFLLLGTSVYLLTSLYGLIGSSIKGVLWFLVFTALAVWIYGRFGSIIEKKSRRVLSLSLALFIIIFAAYFFVDLSVEKQRENYDSFTEVFSTELVDFYREMNEPVFIDFYADWCTSCKVNDAAVLNTTFIKDLFLEKGVHFLKGDFTAGDKEIAQWLSRYNKAGVPLYLLFRPGEEATVFPEFLTKAMIENELSAIKP